MSTPGGILGAGTLVAGKLATTTVFLDDSSAPVLNVAHTFAGGSINLSAGSNPSQGFTVQPVALGNTQLFQGPNALISNTLSVPGTFSVATANISTALNVIGPSSFTGNVQVSGNTTITGNTSVTGPFTASGLTTVGNVLQVGNTVNTPILHSNLITTSAFTATGPLSNCFIDTASATTSNTAALYLSTDWRVKRITSGGLAFQYLLNGTTWTNAQVLAPPGLSITIAGLTTPTS